MTRETVEFTSVRGDYSDTLPGVPLVLEFIGEGFAVLLKTDAHGSSRAALPGFPCFLVLEFDLLP